MRIIRFTIVILALSLFAVVHADLRLIPQPREVEMLGGRFDWSEVDGIALAQPDREDDEFAAKQLVEELKRSMDLNARVATGAAPVILGLVDDEAVQQRLAGVDTTALRERGPEAYLLIVKPEGVVAAGNGTAGTFYAVQTLKQLIRANAEGSRIPCLRMLDWPKLRYRGYSDDISRGPIPTMEFFKRQIRTMSEFKQNMLTFYTEHVFKLKKHPIIAPPDGITADQVEELSDYARKYHVELVGNFQSFGHFAKILRHDEYAHLRETGWVVTPAKEAIYEFLDDVYSEICPAYDSKLFNVNCDETWGLGEGPSKPMVEKIGVGGVYLKHMNRIHDILKKKYGKRMMMWGDIALRHPDIIDQLAGDTILLSWGYGARDSYDGAIEPFVEAGLDFMVCPGVSCWSRIFPHYENAVVNIRNYVRDGAKLGAMGMLNTTWDDDGENLFHWNFYGTNWAAACAWRPAMADRDNYDAAYAQVSYGTDDDDLTRAVKLLASCVHNPLTQGNHDRAFWVRPFDALKASYSAVMYQTADLIDRTQRAVELIDQARHDAKLNKEDLDYIEFAARRLRYIGRARELHLGMAKEYTDAVAQYPDTAPARKALRRAWCAANELVDTVGYLRAEYRRLWLQENRPWWLDRNLAKYDSLLNDLNSYADRLAGAGAQLAETGVPPAPEEVGLELAELNRRKTAAAPAKEPILPPEAQWWDARWPYRIPLLVENGDIARRDYPVEVHVNFGERAIAPESVRVVEYPADGETVPLLTQFDPHGPASGNVVFVAPGQMDANQTRTFAVYYDLADSPRKPEQTGTGVRVSTDGPWHWVENEKYRILVGREGAHIYEWHVKALDGADITHPGRSGWSGFADPGSGRGRGAGFDITAEATGPVMVRLKAFAPRAFFEKLLTFYADKPCVEVMLANPTDFYWDYDNVENFAKDKGHPGTAIFENGHSEPVCESDEQVHAVAEGVTWGAKTRDDGFTLANITPQVKGTHMTGPGGGWGGVGIERSKRAAHFVTFADKVAGDPAVVLNQLADTLTMRDQPRLHIGNTQTRPGRN